MEINCNDLRDVYKVSKRTNIKVTTIRKFVACNEIPFCKFGRLVRFEPEAIEEWIKANKRNSNNTKCTPLPVGTTDKEISLFEVQNDGVV